MPELDSEQIRQLLEADFHSTICKLTHYVALHFQAGFFKLL